MARGRIMWPMGGIFSRSRGQGWHINIITWLLHESYHGNYLALGPDNFHDTPYDPALIIQRMLFCPMAILWCHRFILLFLRAIIITAICGKTFRISALPCNNVNMSPLPSGTGKYATHGPHYPPTGLIMLPSDCIMPPSGSIM